MPTIKDVAVRANTSVSTVSIILNGKAAQRKISPATCERVAAAIRELGYVPSRTARDLQGSSRKKSVALFWANDYRTAMLARFLSGMQPALEGNGAGYEVSVHLYPVGHLAEQQALQGVPAFDGIIVGNAAVDDLAFLAKNKPLVPTVLYNRRLDGFGSVSVDDELVGTMLAQALEGRCRALVLHAHVEFDGAHLREETFAQEFRNTGGTVHTVDLASMTAQAGMDAVRATLEDARITGSSKPFDAICAPSDLVGLGAARACRELGLAVPKDIAIASVGNGIPEYAQFAQADIACAQIPIEPMAEQCINMLIKQVERGERPEELAMEPTSAK